MECQQADGECKCGDDMILCQQVGYVLDALYCRNSKIATKKASEVLNSLCPHLSKSCDTVERLVSRTQMHTAKYIKQFAENFDVKNLSALMRVASSRLCKKNLWQGCLNLYSKKLVGDDADIDVVAYLTEHSKRCITVLVDMGNDTYALNGYAGLLLHYMLTHAPMKESFLAKHNREDEFWETIKKIKNPTLDRYVDKILS